MIDSYEIYKKSKKIIRATETHDAIKIAKQLGIEVISVNYFNNLLGMYTYQYRSRFIFINSNMDEYLTQMVVAHEIGHDLFHRELAKGNGLKEFELFRMQKNTTEYEANAFAAHILLDTDKFIELAHEGYDVAQIAMQMNTEINLALIKLQELIRLGYDLRMPMDTRGDFLKKIKAERGY